MNTPTSQVIIVQTTKNPGIAAILGLIFGPLGLLYVGGKQAGIALVIVVPVLIFTAGFGIFLTAPACAIVGYTGANAWNKKLTEGKS